MSPRSSRLLGDLLNLTRCPTEPSRELSLQKTQSSVDVPQIESVRFQGDHRVHHNEKLGMSNVGLGDYFRLMHDLFGSSRYSKSVTPPPHPVCWRSGKYSDMAKGGQGT
jgi:hypothetical protein